MKIDKDDIIFWGFVVLIVSIFALFVALCVGSYIEQQNEYDWEDDLINVIEDPDKSVVRITFDNGTVRDFSRTWSTGYPNYTVYYYHYSCEIDGNMLKIDEWTSLEKYGDKPSSAKVTTVIYNLDKIKSVSY